jgi:hypothetical protein
MYLQRLMAFLDGVSNEARSTPGSRDLPYRSGSLEWIGTRPEVASNGKSQDCFSQASEWLRDCLESHTLCATSGLDHVKFPTRLIDVSNMKHIHLFDTTVSPLRSINYVALSYCWGSENAYVTERATLHLRMEEMRWDDMPRTFQDAVIVTRELGMSYLWIDSLCIIQNDIDDWAIEASNMAHIYANATCTIAGSAAENDAQGFLVDRTKWRPSAEANVKQRTFKIRQDLHKGGEEATRLYTRGWIFQERLLSRRILYFDKNEIRWECGTMQKCECGSELPPLNFDLCSPSKAQRYLRQSLAVEDSSRDILDWWRKVVVEGYSSLDLTRLTDTLPALSGVAALIHANTKDVYLAGLWHSRFAESLLWKPRNRLTHMPSWTFSDAVNNSFVERNSQAPTWSWASIPTPVAHEVIQESYLELLDHEITLETVDETGGVKQGVILISCPMYPEHLRESNSIEWSQWLVLGEQGRKVQVSAFHDVRERYETTPHRLALIGARRQRLDAQHSSVTFSGICLAQSDMAGYYKRIGHWQARFHESAQAPFDAKVLEQNRERILVV